MPRPVERSLHSLGWVHTVRPHKSALWKGCFSLWGRQVLPTNYPYAFSSNAAGCRSFSKFTRECKFIRLQEICFGRTWLMFRKTETLFCARHIISEKFLFISQIIDYRVRTPNMWLALHCSLVSTGQSPTEGCEWRAVWKPIRLQMM